MENILAGIEAVVEAEAMPIPTAMPMLMPTAMPLAMPMAMPVAVAVPVAEVSRCGEAMLPSLREARKPDVARVPQPHTPLHTTRPC